MANREGIETALRWFRKDQAPRQRIPALADRNSLADSADAITLPADTVDNILKLPGNIEVRFRPVRAEDEPLVAEAIRTASRETLFHRFFTPLRGVPSDQLRRMLSIDRLREACVVGEVEERGRTRLICGARYVRTTDPSVAEIALTVHDDYQRLGIGEVMLRELARTARADGIRRFVADVLPSNLAMMRLLRKLWPGHRGTLADGVYHAEYDLD